MANAAARTSSQAAWRLESIARRPVDDDARGDPHGQRVMRLVERDPGGPVAEEILPFAALDRRRD